MPGISFSAHVALLTELLTRHQAIVDQIESRVLNVQGKDTARNRSREYFDQVFSSCFYDTPGLPRHLSGLKGQLLASHVADGFEPVVLDAAAHTLDPLELILRAYDIWEHGRWPGRNGRLSYARVLFGAFLLRQLEALSLRIWDNGPALAADHLRDVQGLLDRLNRLLHPHVLIRDARWLIQTAQGPLTRHLAPYFRIAEHISASFTEVDRLELHSAGAKLTGGHLRSQLRHRSAELERTADDPGVLAVTRNSNSMDAALLVRDLVPLLAAYTRACAAGDPDARLTLADAILQGVSADPELLLTRLDLLGPCISIEELFVERDAGERPCRTRPGTTYDALLTRYAELIGGVAAALKEDARFLDPAHHTYSPLGLVYGFCADLLSNTAVSTLQAQPQPAFDLTLEDLFVSRVNLENKLTRVQGWQRPPAREVEREVFEHSREWASQVFQRTLAALHLRAAHPADSNASNVSSARMFVVPRNQTTESSAHSLAPTGVVPAQDHCVSSDVNRALTNGTTAFPRSQILRDRSEGRFLASDEIDGKWFGVSKTILTEVIAQGSGALIVDLPEGVVDVLQVTCPGLVVIVADSRQPPEEPG